MTHKRKHLFVLAAFAAALALRCVPVLAADPPLVEVVPLPAPAGRPLVPPLPAVDVAARAAAIDSLPSVFCGDVLADPKALPEVVAVDAPAYPVLLSARPRMFPTAGAALAGDLRALLQPAWVPDGDELFNCTLELADWPGPPKVTQLAKYATGGAVIFIATSSWGQRATINTSPGKRVRSFGTHEALAQRVLELCRQFLAPQFVPGDAKDIVAQTKFLLLADGKTGVLRGRRGPLWIWSDGQTLFAAGRLFERKIGGPARGSVSPAVALNGRSVFPAGQEATLLDGVTIVPLREFCGYVGARVDWLPHANAATVGSASKVGWFQEGNRVALLDGVETELPTAPRIVDGKMLVPLRPVVEWLGGSLAWHEETHMVNVYLPLQLAEARLRQASAEPAPAG